MHEQLLCVLFSTSSGVISIPLGNIIGFNVFASVSFSDPKNFKILKDLFEKAFLRWCRARDLFGSQIPVTTGGFELRISRIRNLTH